MVFRQQPVKTRHLIYILVFSCIGAPAFAQPTPTPPVMTVPYTEDFNGPWSGGAPSNYPNIWSKQFISGTTNWVQYSGCIDEAPPAHCGYNALFYQKNWSEPETRLISPPLEFGSLTRNTKLSFWHCQSDWPDDGVSNQDELTVYYRLADAGSWVELTHYPNNIPTWTLQTLELPSPTNRYFVCFKGYAFYGYGIGLDDVYVTGQLPTTPSVTPTPSMTPSPSPAETPTVTPTPVNLICRVILDYSTYLGGTGTVDYGYGISVGTDGRAYVTGTIRSSDFPWQILTSQAAREVMTLS